MTAFIAFLIIYKLEMSPWLYLIAILIWFVEFRVRTAKLGALLDTIDKHAG